MAKRKGASTSGPRTRSKAAKEGRGTREVENAKRLDKLPPEVWGKILDELDENDLFPLALSCKYFRQKQKELVARTSQSGKRRLTLKTTLRDVWNKSFPGQPMSAEYLRLCSKAEVPQHKLRVRNSCITRPAAYHGHLPLLQELLADSNWLGTEYAKAWHMRHTLDPGIPQAAARGGQLETLKWLKTQEGFELESWLFAQACEGGHWEIIRWLRSEGCPWNADACKGAARAGHFEIVKWLRSEGCPWNPRTNISACTDAAGGGHWEILKWLRREGCPWSGSAYQEAAKNGNFEIMKWLRSEGCPLDIGAYNGAAEGGYLEILRWLKREGCPWNTYTCYYAAKGGHLEALKWLRSEGCPWDHEACVGAALGGHLEVLKWLRSEGCPWCRRTWLVAAESTKEWLQENGCPQDSDDESDYPVSIEGSGG